MGRKVSCHCDDPSLDEVLAGDGRVMGYLCLKCMLPTGFQCNVCRKRFRHVSMHLKRNEVCKDAAKKRQFWGDSHYEAKPADRPLYPFSSESKQATIDGEVSASGLPEGSRRSD